MLKTPITKGTNVIASMDILMEGSKRVDIQKGQQGNVAEIDISAQMYKSICIRWFTPTGYKFRWVRPMEIELI